MMAETPGGGHGFPATAIRCPPSLCGKNLAFGAVLSAVDA